MSIIRFSLALFLICLVTIPAYAKNIQAREATLRDRVSNPTCSTDSECKSIGFLKRACGGFEEHLIYSMTMVDEKNLIADVEQFNADEFERRKDMMSICAFEMPPELVCTNGTCQAQ